MRAGNEDSSTIAANSEDARAQVRASLASAKAAACPCETPKQSGTKPTRLSVSSAPKLKGEVQSKELLQPQNDDPNVKKRKTEPKAGDKANNDEDKEKRTSALKATAVKAKAQPAPGQQLRVTFAEDAGSKVKTQAGKQKGMNADDSRSKAEQNTATPQPTAVKTDHPTPEPAQASDASIDRRVRALQASLNRQSTRELNQAAGETDTSTNAQDANQSDGDDSESEDSEEKRRKAEKIRIKKAVHARYMRFSRSLHSTLAIHSINPFRSIHGC